MLETIKYVNYDIEQFEVIVVDDCSEKPVSDLIQLFHRYYKIKYIRNRTNLGRAAARNRGAEVAIGEILIFNDGDRIMDTDFIVQHVNQIKNHEDVVCIGNNIELYTTDKNMPVCDFANAILDCDNKVFMNRKFNYYYQQLVMEMYNESGETDSNMAWISLLSGNFSILQKHFTATKGFNTAFTKWGIENIEFGYRLMQNHIKFYYNHMAINYHLFHKQDRSASNLKESINYFYDRYKDKNILRYYDFLQEKISINELLNSTLSGKFYSSNCIGSRYKRKEK